MRTWLVCPRCKALGERLANRPSWKRLLIERPDWKAIVKRALRNMSPHHDARHEGPMYEGPSYMPPAIELR